MIAADQSVFAFRPNLRLGIGGDADALRHFRAEYGASMVREPSECDVEVVFGARSGGHSAATVAGGHKTVSWNVQLEPADGAAIRATIHLRGRPRSFGLSLVQGYFVEPLVAVSAARRGTTLLPAAAIEDDGGAILLIGRSRSGKSSVCARALAAGRTILGDDHVLVDRAGQCFPFPRRMRFYPDVRRTARAAYDTLPGRTKAALLGRRIVGSLTRGYVAPPVRVAPDRVGSAPAPAPLPLARVVVIDRDGESSRVVANSATPDVAVAQAMDVLSEQRTKLAALRDPTWQASLADALEADRNSLRGAFQNVTVVGLTVPRSFGASASIAALAEELGIRS